ncbi:cation-transporting ATPase 4, partial [Apiospora kogelbergensis]|uniref:cation-transporting ATPase 4 n=1 Tax=Apiospora kogelbergensis TaxID=1337665 RepID=UPI003131439E
PSVAMANDDRGSELCYVAIIFTAISLFCLGLRCYTMGFILKRFFLADWTAVLTGLNQCAFCAFTLLGVKNGLGKHVVDVSPENRIEALKWKWAGQVSYVVGSTLIKFVAGLLLLRLFAGQRWQRITIIFLMVLVGLVQIFYLFIAIFQCTPVPFYWYRYTAGTPSRAIVSTRPWPRFPPTSPSSWGSSATGSLHFSPSLLCARLRWKGRPRYPLSGFWPLAPCTASLANVVRIPYAKQLLSSPDYLHNFTDLAIWSIIECALGLTATSLATLRPLFVRINMLASSQVLSTFRSRPRTSRRNNSTGPSASRGVSKHPDTQDREVFSKHQSMNSDSHLSQKVPPVPVDFLPSEQRAVQQVPPAFYPNRERSRTVPFKDAQGAWSPRPPSTLWNATCHLPPAPLDKILECVAKLLYDIPYACHDLEIVGEFLHSRRSASYLYRQSSRYWCHSRSCESRNIALATYVMPVCQSNVHVDAS